MILLGNASRSSSLCCLGNVAGRKCLICPWRTCNICECACVHVRGEEGGWKGARGVWGRLCTTTFILLYIYSHPVRGCYMITDYIFSSTLKSMIYKRNNWPYPPPQILTLKLGAATFSYATNQTRKGTLMMVTFINITIKYRLFIQLSQ